MKAVVIENYGGKEELKEKEVAMPKAGKNQVIVKKQQRQLIRLIGSFVKDT